jgi:hypothetical protein
MLLMMVGASIVYDVEEAINLYNSLSDEPPFLRIYFLLLPACAPTLKYSINWLVGVVS